MKKIIVSQRRDSIVGRDEERDAMDVRIGKLLFDLGFLPIFLCSDITDYQTYFDALKPDGILLGSGNDLGEYPKRDALEKALLDYAAEKELPVLAICRGTQMINHYLGGQLKPVANQVATYVAIEGKLAEQYGYSQVNSYHNLGIDSAHLSNALEVVAQTQQGIVKAIQHKNLPWLGIMWHPEREKKILEQDRKLILGAFIN